MTGLTNKSAPSYIVGMNKMSLRYAWRYFLAVQVLFLAAWALTARALTARALTARALTARALTARGFDCGLTTVALVLGLTTGVSSVRAQEVVPTSREQIQLTFAPIVRETASAVVNIATRTKVTQRSLDPFFDDPFFRHFFDGFPGVEPLKKREQQSLGSGVIIREDGLVVTNHHVIEGADEIKVILSDRREFVARLLLTDERSDLALLQIDAGDALFDMIELGDSDRIDVGDVVLAIGNPFGIGQTVTSGIISATARTAPNLERDVSFIQTDAAINPGNSGGALVGLDGRLVGVNTAIFTRGGGSIGIGFAIPANLVRARINQLEQSDGMIERPWIGASLQMVDSNLARSLGLDRPKGVLVNQVYPGSASDRAGLTAGDVILAVDGTGVSDVPALNFRLNLKPIGDAIDVDLWRQGATRQASIELEPPIRDPEPDVALLDPGHPLVGLKLANLSPGFNHEVGIDPFARGVVVLEVVRRSRAHRMGLRAGDTFVSVDGLSIATRAEMENMMKSNPAPWRLGIRRGRQDLHLDLQP